MVLRFININLHKNHINLTFSDLFFFNMNQLIKTRIRKKPRCETELFNKNKSSRAILSKFFFLLFEFKREYIHGMEE